MINLCLLHLAILITKRNLHTQIFVPTVTVHHEIFTNKYNNSKNRYRSTSRDWFSYDRSTTPPHNTLSRCDDYKNTFDLISLFTDQYTDHPIDVTIVTGIDLVHVLEAIILHDVHSL